VQWVNEYVAFGTATKLFRVRVQPFRTTSVKFFCSIATSQAFDCQVRNHYFGKFVHSFCRNYAAGDGRGEGTLYW
jgi:hypothetical protein